MSEHVLPVPAECKNMSMQERHKVLQSAAGHTISANCPPSKPVYVCPVGDERAGHCRAKPLKPCHRRGGGTRVQKGRCADGKYELDWDKRAKLRQLTLEQFLKPKSALPPTPPPPVPTAAPAPAVEVKQPVLPECESAVVRKQMQSCYEKLVEPNLKKMQNRRDFFNKEDQEYVILDEIIDKYLTEVETCVRSWLQANGECDPESVESVDLQEMLHELGTDYVEAAFTEVQTAEELRREKKDPRARLEQKMYEEMGNLPPIAIVRKQLGDETAEDYRMAMEKMEDIEDLTGLASTETSKRKLWNKAQLEAKVRMVMMMSEAGSIYEALEQYEQYQQMLQRRRKREREEKKAIRVISKPKRQKKAR